MTPDPAELVRRMVAAYGRGDWVEALEAAEAYAVQAPEEAEPVYWTACIRSRAGDADGALAGLRAGSERGFWWAPEMLRDDPDLEAARGAPGFADVVAVSERRMAEARQDVEPTLLSEGEGDRVLLALHGRMGVVDEALEAWLPAVAGGLPRGRAGLEPAPLVGRRGLGRPRVARRELDWAEAQLGTGPRVLGGFSQGGMLAIAEAVAGARTGSSRWRRASAASGCRRWTSYARTWAAPACGARS